jgi:hypothetical protein
MKALILLYSQLLKSGKEDFYKTLDRNVELLKRLVGVDGLYASVSSHFKEIFDRFPELCIINSIKDSSVFGAYRGLRKLRGDDVLLIDGGAKLSKEHILSLFNRLNVTVGLFKESWAGIAYIKMRDIDYVIKSLERNFERSILDAFHTLKDKYSIITEFIQLRGTVLKPILDVK